jgi:hypothetical protein
VDAPKQVHHIDEAKPKNLPMKGLLPQPKTALCLLNITSNVNITMVPGINCSKPFGTGSACPKSPARKLRRASKQRKINDGRVDDSFIAAFYAIGSGLNTEMRAAGEQDLLDRAWCPFTEHLLRF